MKHILAAAFAASTVIALPAAAQTLSPPVIIVVDMQKVLNDSAAGRGASTDIQGRIASLRARASTLQQSLQAESAALRQQAQAKTLPQPQLEQRANALGQRQQAAQQELATSERQIQVSGDYVSQQINDAATPIISAIMRERGAQIVLSRQATFQTTASIDVTNDVVARLNTSLPRVSTTPPAQTAPATPPRR